MNFERTLRSGVIAMLFAGAWTAGCGAQSPEVPEDDDGNGNGGTGMGGALPTGGVSNGGAFPSGGVSTGGAFPSGGASTGGAFPSGGATSTGGAGGSTGSCGPTVATAADAAIDDLEDGENGIITPRLGYWYTYNDMSAGCAQMPAPDPSGATPFLPAAGAGNGMFAARTTGGACGTWGAGMGFDLANCMSESRPYNASVFNGLSFWYKSTTQLRVIVGTTGVIPTSRGGTCIPGTAMGTECDNGHNRLLDPAPAGTIVTVSFDPAATNGLTQHFGQNVTFDKTQIVNIQWQVEQGMAFDFTIDDVAFTP